MSSATSFPLVGQPLGQLADGQGWQVSQQLREIQLRVYIVPAASAGEAGQDGRRSASIWIANEETVLAIEEKLLCFPARKCTSIIRRFM